MSMRDYGSIYLGPVGITAAYRGATLVFGGDPTVPGAFAATQWAVATGAGPGQVALSLFGLPNSGGRPVTAIEYSIDSGGTWTALTGAAAGVHTLDLSAVETAFAVMIRAVNALGAGPASGTKTATSGAAAVAAPVVTQQPAITGTPAAGETLTGLTGAATGGAVAVRQWLRGGTAIAGATGTTLLLGAADVGASITLRVTWNNAGGTVTAVSAAVGPVVAAAVVPAAPTHTVAPSIAGTATVGQTLTATEGTWTGSPTVTLQWLRGTAVIGGATGLTYVLGAADLGATIRVRATATNAGGSAQATSTAVGPVENPVAAVETPQVYTGTYTGNGSFRAIDVGFDPDFVIVAREGTTPIMWRTNTAWHNRTQFFNERASEYAIVSASQVKASPFSDGKFGVIGNANVSGAAYHVLAVRGVEHSSWIGNATAGRNIDWMDAAPEAVIVKRDNTKGSVLHDGTSGVFLHVLRGASTAITALTGTGITVSAQDEVNQFVPPAIGEGLEGLGFRNSGAIRVTRYAGDGAGNRTVAVGHTPTAALVFTMLDNFNQTGHAFATSTMAAGTSLAMSGSAVTNRILSLGSGGVQVHSNLNRTGTTYTVISFAGEETLPARPGYNLAGKSGLLVNANTVELQNFPALGEEASTLEFFGRAVAENLWQNAYYNHAIMPLLMLGSAKPGAYTSNTYNGGLYLALADPDGHDWDGAALRWLNSSYFQIARDENEGIGKYNLNSGVVVPYQKDVHILLTHDGAGHWQLFVDGKKVKDTMQDMRALYGRPNGGAGDAGLSAYLLTGRTTKDALEGQNGWVYRAAAWKGTALTRAQAHDRWQSLTRGGTAYAGPAPTREYDFRNGTMPSGVTTVASVRSAPTAAFGVDPKSIPNTLNGWQGYARMELQASGALRCIAVHQTSPWVYLEVDPGRTYSLRTLADVGTGTGLTVYSDDNGLNTAVAGVTHWTQTATGTVDRTDVITIPANHTRLFIQGNGASYPTGYFEILPGMSLALQAGA